MWLWPLKMPTQNFLMLLVLVKLMLRNVLTKVWSRFWGWGLLEILYLVFGHNIEPEVLSILKRWSLVEILWLKIGQDLKPYDAKKSAGVPDGMQRFVKTFLNKMCTAQAREASMRQWSTLLTATRSTEHVRNHSKLVWLFQVLAKYKAKARGASVGPNYRPFTRQ